MRFSGLLFLAILSAVLLAPGCAKEESSMDKALESTKDALDIREHEKLKDAGEDVSDAVNDAAEGIKDAANGN